MMCDVTQ